METQAVALQLHGFAHPVNAMTTLKMSLMLLVCLPFVTSAATPSPLTLEETFHAYVDLVTRGDTDAAAKLKADAARAKDPDTLVDIIDDMSSIGTARDISDAPELQATASAVYARQREVSCNVTSMKVTESAASESAEVHYQCQFPDLSGFFDTYRAERKLLLTEGKDAARESTMLAAYVESIRNAPSSAQEGTAEFRRQGTGGPWMSLDMLDLARKMTLSMVPFAQWDERIEAESVPTVTGIAPCDVMLDAQIGFLQKSHPDHEGLLLRSEVESNVTRLGPALAAAHCRAFHDQNRALWEGAPSAASD